MNSIQLVIFDLDGTLINSLDDLADTTNHMLSAMGRDRLTLPSVKKLVGQGARSLVERALPDASLAEVEFALELFLSYNAAHIVDKTRLYRGVKETLSALRTAGYPLAVLSNKNAALCHKVIETLGLKDFFESVMGADTVPFRKPSPEPLWQLIRGFRVSTEDTVMIGDSINDIAAGKAAGVVTVGCTYGYGELAELEEADYTVDTFPELLELPIFARYK